MSSNIFSSGIDLQQEWIYSIQALWSGPSVGELKLQISNDNPSPPLSGPPGTDPASKVVNWTTYSGSASSVSAQAGSSSFMWNVLYPGYRWTRVSYTAISGSGELSIQYFGKGQ